MGEHLCRSVVPKNTSRRLLLYWNYKKKKKTEIQTLGGELNQNLQYINEYASFERIVVHGIGVKLVSNWKQNM